MTKALTRAVLLFVSPILLGCDNAETTSSGSSPVQASPVAAGQTAPAVDETEAIRRSWQNFTNEVRSRCGSNKGDLHEEETTLVSDDLRKSDSLKSPYLGLMTLKYVYKSVSGRYFSFEYYLEFAYANGQWKYSKGEGKRVGGNDPDRASEIGKTFSITNPAEKPAVKQALPPSSYSG